MLAALAHGIVLAQSPVDTCRNPAPPIITGSATGICRAETVTLSATGCVGTVVWSNSETGNTIVVRPQQTTKYTAICRARPGCISCFAEVWKVTVNTPDAPVITAVTTPVCPDDAVTLTAANCTGVVRWPDQRTGLTWTGRLRETTAFRATCEQNGCISNPSKAALVQVSPPTVPVISTDKADICAGQLIQLAASNCAGIVRWSDGGEGLVRTVTPARSTTYRAVCQIGSCRSDSSARVSVGVRPSGQLLLVSATLSNGCPFQTADLSKAIADGELEPDIHYLFLTGSSPNAPAVQPPGAVLAGTYYIIGRTTDGCYTEPATVTVSISPCRNGISPCLSNPPIVRVRLDTLDWARGVVQLRGQMGGSAYQTAWQSSGGGLFADAGLNARYLLSETDRQRGTATFTLSAPDPDADGPCAGASAQLTVTAPAAPAELIGLSKKASEPVWVVAGNARLIELTYQLTVVNPGKNALTNVMVSDDLDAAFAATGASFHLTSVRADSGFVVNPAYIGRGADTTLLTAGSRLPAGGQGRIWLTVQLDVSQANTLTFSNEAFVQALGVTGAICRDRSTNGTDADPDKNGDPSDNDDPTRVTLQSLRPDEGETVFIPEGFSPNGDGINDRFVIRYLPLGLTVTLDVYNRWGHLVYQSANYKNDWDGTANQGINAGRGKPDLPDGTYYYQIRLGDGREFVRFMTLAR